MRLATEFIQLPLLFDAQKLAQEAEQFPESEWESHPQDDQGNSALRLVAACDGSDKICNGRMHPTALLDRCPYIKQVLASFNSVIGSTRLKRMEPGTEVSPHCDTDYYWQHRVRIHIPIITDAHVRFSSVGNIDVNMKPGEAWIFDNWKTHAVKNEVPTRHVYLVIDTTGSSDFWALADTGNDPRQPGQKWQSTVRKVAFDAGRESKPAYEQFDSVAVRAPDEIDNMTATFTDELNTLQNRSPDLHKTFLDTVLRFKRDWRSYWSLYGDTAEGLPHYEQLTRNFHEQCQPLLVDVTLDTNGALATEVLDKWLSVTTDASVVRARASVPGVLTADTSLFDRPVFIVAAPRSGSTMLFEMLGKNQEFWTIGDESHAEFESIKQLHPASHGFTSNVLDEKDATPEVVATLVGAFIRKLKNTRGTLYSEIPSETQVSQIRFLEKTPKNALRIPFLLKIFPQARFVFLHRSAPQNIGSIMDAWNSGNFVTYPRLPGWQGQPWSLLLPEGWRDLQGKPLAHIAAWQWSSTNQTILQDLQQLPEKQWCTVRYEDLVSDKLTQIRRLCEFADVPFGPRMQNIATEKQPLSRYTLSAPDPDKWHKHRTEIESVLDLTKAVQEQLRDL